MSVPKELELELLAAVLLDRPRAWEHFCLRFGKVIYGCVLKAYRCYRSIASYSEDDIADAVQDVYVDLLRDDRKKLRAFDRSRGYQLSSWIGLIATRLTIQNLRSSDPALESLDAETQNDESGPHNNRLARVADPEPQPDELCEQLERRARVMRALGKLSPADRELVSGPKPETSGALYKRRWRILHELLAS